MIQYLDKKGDKHKTSLCDIDQISPEMEQANYQ